MIGDIMNYEDELIYEMYFRYKNMSKEDGDFYLDVLRHSKEITDSAYGYKPQYDIVEMSLMSTENGIRFNGSITNGMENRYITGTMISRLNKTFVDISVERLLGDIPNREYNAVEVFKFKRDEVERRTCYSNGEYYEAILEPFEQEKMEEYKLSHLKELEAESIHIIREVAAEFENPVMLYSIGKDSSVMVRLAEKAFYPGKVPFPLMHIDSKWKFKEMIQFRDEYAKKYGWNLIVESNMEAFHAGVGPFTHGSKVHTDLMKTKALLSALDKYKFDAAFGGARRDEEKSRAKERIFSFRDKFHQWDPKNQRPELWDIYNARVHKGESIRVFPLSNWTELDIWQYIRLENIPIVPLYYAKERPCVTIDGNLIMADDDRLPEKYRDQIEMKTVRFRTLGCWPLTGAVESNADTIETIVEEMMTTTKSERTTRVIDFDQEASMEQKKREGYF